MNPKKLAEVIKPAKRIAIMGHKGGDSDCYGSAFGFASALEKLGKEVKIVLGEEFPQSLDYLFFYYPGELVNDMEKIDLLILLDTSDLNKLSIPKFAKDVKSSGAKIVQVDHHTVGDLTAFVDFSFVNHTACSASEMVFELIKEMGIKIDKDIATCLLAGIIGDTSSFQNQNTTKECFAAASELMKFGGRLSTIVNNTFGGKEVDVLKVWGLAMERLNYDTKTGIAETYLLNEDISNYGLSPDVVSGVINFLNSIKGARVILLIVEEEIGTIKVSMRTRDEQVNLAKLARQLGGGGHVKAAGFSFPGSLKSLTVEKNNHIVIV